MLRTTTAATVIAAAAAAAASVWGASSAARAQTPDHVLLARSCISERGWRTDTDDCAAIAEVVRARVERRGGSFRDSLVALAPRLHGGTIERRRWILDLDEDCHRPAGYPRGLPWEGERGHRDECLETMAEARAILAGEIPSPCVERPEHWGSRADVRRRVLAGMRWRDASCPDATFANRFGFLARPYTSAGAAE